MKQYRLYSSLPDISARGTVAEIDTEALVSNYKLLCSRAEGVSHICVIKSDAYGHSADICVKALLGAGCDFFAVSSIEEAISVRNSCVDEGRDANILILGYTDPTCASLLAEYDIIQAILSFDFAESLNKAAMTDGVRVRTHIALDTGMNRIGLCAFDECSCRKATESISSLCSLDGIAVEGMFTHFAKADEDGEDISDDDSHVRRQFERFNAVKIALEDKGIKLFCHVCNSAATVRFPTLALDGVRLGILLYGARSGSCFPEGLLPVMKLKGRVAHIHTLLPGESVSYGGTFSSDKERMIATVPIGYADGFARSYSGSEVTVHTREGDFKATVVGRVCMDQFMIDVTGLPVSVGDGITVFGDDPSSLKALAQMSDTIEYECLCRISARVPRIIKKNVMR
jgi:alanine racemase